MLRSSVLEHSTGNSEVLGSPSPWQMFIISSEFWIGIIHVLRKHFFIDFGPLHLPANKHFVMEKIKILYGL